jgi:hypothetical protein
MNWLQTAMMVTGVLCVLCFVAAGVITVLQYVQDMWRKR